MKYERLTRKSECGYNTLESCLNCDLEMDCGLCPHWTEALDRLAELEDKIEQGTLIELPCKIGDTIYLVCKNCEITNWKITHIEISEKNTTFIIEHKTTKIPSYVYLSELEKSFFLNHKKAKKRLKELKNE